MYVGETTRLYRRWHEHSSGRGGITTSSDNYDTLVGLYNACHNINFLDYFKQTQHDSGIEDSWDEDVDRGLAMEVENHITERYMLNNKSVKGGKYCRERCIVDLTRTIIDRPFCKCGYLCEVNMKKDKTKLYFTCPIPEWVEYGYNIPYKCNFWKEYEPYRSMREQYELESRKEYAIRMRQKNLAAYIEATKDD